jgi:hypothetical protein
MKIRLIMSVERISDAVDTSVGKKGRVKWMPHERLLKRTINLIYVERGLARSPRGTRMMEQKYKGRPGKFSG